MRYSGVLVHVVLIAEADSLARTLLFVLLEYSPACMVRYCGIAGPYHLRLFNGCMNVA